MDIGWSTTDASIAASSKETGVFYPSTTELRQNLGYRPLADARMIVKTTKALGNVDITATLKKDSFMGFGTVKDSVSLSFVEDAIVVPGRSPCPYIYSLEDLDIHWTHLSFHILVSPS